MRLLVTGGLGVLGCALLPLLEATGHEVSAPGPRELDLFDAGRVRAAVERVQGVFHLATHIPPTDRMGDREAWRENDRLRGDTSRLLVDAALAATVVTYVVPTTVKEPSSDINAGCPSLQECTLTPPRPSVCAGRCPRVAWSLSHSREYSRFAG
jgi:nucleoside-diphosphate-sugar epimerase